MFNLASRAASAAKDQAVFPFFFLSWRASSRRDEAKTRPFARNRQRTLSDTTRRQKSTRIAQEQNHRRTQWNPGVRVNVKEVRACITGVPFRCESSECVLQLANLADSDTHGKNTHDGQHVTRTRGGTKIVVKWCRALGGVSLTQTHYVRNLARIRGGASFVHASRRKAGVRRRKSWSVVLAPRRRRFQTAVPATSGWL